MTRLDYLDAFKQGMKYALTNPERRLGADLEAAQRVMRSYPMPDANLGTYFGMGIAAVMDALTAFAEMLPED